MPYKPGKRGSCCKHFQTEDLSILLIKKQTTYSPPELIGCSDEEQMNKYAKKVLIPTGTWLDVLGLAIYSGMFVWDSVRCEE